VNLQADRPGIYHGLSAQFSGEGFADMAFEVRAVSASDYARWIADTQAAGETLDRDTYKALAQPSKHVAPTTYKSVDPGLFDSIVSGSEQPVGDRPGSAGGQDQPKSGGGV